MDSFVDNFAGGLLALLGVALGSFLESLRAKRQFRAQQRAQFFEREQHVIQEVFEVVAEHRLGFEHSITVAMAVLRGGDPESFGSHPIPWERLRVLSSLYAPELGPALRALDALNPHIFGRMALARSEKLRSGQQTEQLVQELSKDFSRIGDIYDEMQQALLARGEELRALIRADAGLPPLKAEPAAA